TFLGTGTSQGVPVIGCTCKVCQSGNPKDNRLRTSILIEEKGETFVIDTGPDFRQQMLREDIKRLDAVIFTHSHKDHIAGLDDVRAYNYIQKVPMPIYGTKALHKQLKSEFYYAFSGEKYPGIPQLNLIEINEEPFTTQGVTFTPLPVLHLRMPVLGFRVGDFSYITDSNQIPDSTLEKLKGTRVLVLNSLQREKHVSHFNLTEAVAMARKIGASKTYFTHISHKLGTHRKVEKELPESIALGFDGLTIEL
ncbi:MAG: MBL fold metallo-hydrolase, partial [Bacteroidia bacterium]|nr:MBL fold metallo-hydrolase [Bacteroidia bacterium]